MNRKRVLIVDDEAAMRFLLSKQLNRAGYDTTTVADGVEALAAAANESFDAVVLDVVMPGIDGYEVCRRLKADAQTADVPVIFLSASSNGDFRRRAFRVGAADFLAKPFQIRNLPDYIQTCCRRAEETVPTPGRIDAVIGDCYDAGSAMAAIQIAESAALQGPNPVMLIDLELPAGSIGAKLQLSGGPNMRLLLQDTGEAVSMELIDRVAQRYHGALQVIPAPFSISRLEQPEPEPQRLATILDTLTGHGYRVIVHLGCKIEGLALTALKRADVVWATTGSEQEEAFETLLGAIMAVGIDRERVTSLREATGDGLSSARVRPQARAQDITGNLAMV